MPIELLLLVLAWVATFSLIVVVPWVVVRLAVRVLEADVSKLRADRERAQPHTSLDTVVALALSDEQDDIDELDDAVASPAMSERDVDG